MRDRDRAQGGRTLLHLLARADNAAGIKLLLSLTPTTAISTAVERADDDGMRALDVACRVGALRAVAALLEVSASEVSACV
jgi:ankyrin repeat protein